MEVRARMVLSFGRDKPDEEEAEDEEYDDSTERDG